MYALIVDGAVAKYPYTIGNLRKDNPSTSFPKRPDDTLLAEWGMRLVTKTDRPTIDLTKNVVEGDPVLNNGIWTQVWVVADASVEEITRRNEQAANGVRSQRDNLLASTDWLVIKAQETGVAMDQVWLDYRQALRDITSHPNFPYITEDDWPVVP